MEKIRKFFDEGNNETTSDKAIVCQELEFNSNGQVITESWYYAESRKELETPKV